MKRLLIALLPLTLAACASRGYSSAFEAYLDGLYARENDPRQAEMFFDRARDRAEEALDEGDLNPTDRISAASILIRCHLELNDRPSAEAVVQRYSGGFKEVDPYGKIAGDVAGLALLRGAWWRSQEGLENIERAYAAYVMGEVRVQGLRARTALDREKIEVLREKILIHLEQKDSEGLKRAKLAHQAAVEIATAHIGKQDPAEKEFNDLRADLLTLGDRLR